MKNCSLSETKRTPLRLQSCVAKQDFGDAFDRGKPWKMQNLPHTPLKADKFAWKKMYKVAGILSGWLKKV